MASTQHTDYPSAPPPIGFVHGSVNNPNYPPGYPQQHQLPQQQQPPPQPAPPPYTPAYTHYPIDVEADPKPINDDSVFISDAFSEKTIRMAFIRKVYSLLLCQLLVSLGFIALFLFQRDIQRFVQTNLVIYYVSYGVFIVTYISLVCCNVGRKYPANYICLSVFTLAMSYMLGTISSFYDTQSVLIAVGICTVVCLGLTLFSIQTKIDFTVCSGFLFVIGLILLIFGICVAFYPSRIALYAYSALGALVFSLYLIFDTQLIIGGRKYELSPEEYVYASLRLYLDMVNMFLYILMIVGLGKK